MFRITRWGIKGHCDSTLMDKRTREPGRKHWVRERRLLFKQNQKNLTCDICIRHVHKSFPFDRFRYKRNKTYPYYQQWFLSGRGSVLFSHGTYVYSELRPRPLFAPCASFEWRRRDDLNSVICQMARERNTADRQIGPLKKGIIRIGKR